MDAIETSSKLQKKLLYLIAHRLTTVKRCNVIFYLDNGELIDSATMSLCLDKNSDL